VAKQRDPAVSDKLAYPLGSPLTESMELVADGTCWLAYVEAVPSRQRRRWSRQPVLPARRLRFDSVSESRAITPVPPGAPFLGEYRLRELLVRAPSLQPSDLWPIPPEPTDLRHLTLRIGQQVKEALADGRQRMEALADGSQRMKDTLADRRQRMKDTLADRHQRMEEALADRRQRMKDTLADGRQNMADGRQQMKEALADGRRRMKDMLADGQRRWRDGAPRRQALRTRLEEGAVDAADRVIGWAAALLKGRPRADL
jgi:hypothetical protein